MPQAASNQEDHVVLEWERAHLVWQLQCHALPHECNAHSSEAWQSQGLLGSVLKNKTKGTFHIDRFYLPAELTMCTGFVTYMTTMPLSDFLGRERSGLLSHQQGRHHHLPGKKHCLPAIVPFSSHSLLSEVLGSHIFLQHSPNITLQWQQCCYLFDKL